MRELAKFLRRVIPFLAPVLLLLGAAEWVLRSYSELAVRRESLERGKDGARALVLGSSREDRLRTGVLPPTVLNLASVSQALYQDSRILLHHGDRMPGLEVVVQGLSYFSLGHRLEDTHEYWRVYFYLRHYGFFGSAWPRYILDLRNFSLYFALGPQFARPALARYLRHGTFRPPSPPHAGAAPERDPAWAAEELERDTRRHNEAFLNTDAWRENLAYLEETARYAHRRGLPVVLLTLPVAPEYLARTRPENWRALREAVSALAERTGIPIEYRDYTGDPRFLSNEYYDDAFHFNARGAAKFERVLHDEVLSRWIPVRSGDRGLTSGP